MVDEIHKIKLSKEKRQEMVADIKGFFQKERDEEMGDLSAGILLDFITEKLALEFYNQGISDSYDFINDKIIDLLGLQK